jgi:hypothetical protein
MSLATTYDIHHSCQGDASDFASLHEVVDRIEAFLRQTLPRIIKEVKGWTPCKKKRRNEKIMAADLSKELNFAATNEVFYFHPEDPENESATRTIDWGLYPNGRLLVQGHSPGAKERLYAIEAKRLPTNEGSIDGREREYVVGDWHGRNLANKNLKGGIERLKEGVHGEGLEQAGMVAFVQRKTASHWLGKVNEWISELVTNPLKSHTANWDVQDQLTEQAPPGAGITEYKSTHNRSDGSAIHLTHFWLDLTAQ